MIENMAYSDRWWMVQEHRTNADDPDFHHPRNDGMERLEHKESVRSYLSYGDYSDGASKYPDKEVRLSVETGD